MYFYHPHTGRFEQSTKGLVRSSAYSLGAPNRKAYDDLYVPFTPIHHYPYDSTGNEYATRSEINKELIMSSAAMEDNYDISSRSRKRDKEVLAAANRAINSSTGSSTVREATSLKGSLTGVKRLSTTRRAKSSPRSQSVPEQQLAYRSPNSPSYGTTTTVVPLDLTPSPKPSSYLQYSNTLNSIKSLRNKSYQPLYSQAKTSFSPYRDSSPYRSDSPYRSPSPPDDSSSRLIKTRHKPPRVLVSKKRVGNYYNRLMAKRSNNGKEGKYWPYIDVEDIETENVSDLFDHSDIENPEYSEDSIYGQNYVVSSSAGDDYVSPYPSSYVYDYGGDADIPDEYVPFKPRARYHSPERDYSKLSVLPYLPKRDPMKTAVGDDISFNAIVAESAARARKALENIRLDDYDRAGLVLSVEGEYKPPQDDTALGFRYISRPIMLKVPAAQRVRATDSDSLFTKYLTDLREFREGVRARLEEGYKALSRETGEYYSHTLPTSTTLSYSTYNRPALPPYRKHLTEDAGYKYGHSLELYPSGTSYRSLPAAEHHIPQSRALTIYDAKYDKDSKMGMLARIEIKVDTEIESSPRSAVATRRATRGQSTPPMSSTYSKSEVHVALARASPDKLTYKAPPVLSRRRRSRYPRVTVMHRLRYYVPVRGLRYNKSTLKTRERSPDVTIEGFRHAPLSILAYLRNLEQTLLNKSVWARSVNAATRTTSKKAALLGSKMDSLLPGRSRHPRSSYAQAKMSHLRKEKWEDTEALPAESTTGLKAHKPVHISTYSKPIYDVGGVRKPNIMSWQYRLDALVSPDDLILLPRSLASVKSRLHDVHDKLDRHRQLMDRYLATDKGLTTEDMRA